MRGKEFIARTDFLSDAKIVCKCGVYLERKHEMSEVKTL